MGIANNMQNKQVLTCVMIGEESLLIQCAHIWQELGHRIEAIVSTTPSIVEWAHSENIRTLPFDKALFAALQSHSFDYLFSVANLKVISTKILSLAQRDAINFHDGLLPHYAGLYTTTWSLINQEREHGITWHRMAEKVDAGGILHQQRFPVAPDETVFSLNVKCYEAGIATFRELAQQIVDGTATPESQNLSQQTYYGRERRPLAGGLIDWSQTGAQINALSRALSFNGYDNPLALPKIYLAAQGLVLSPIVELGETRSDKPMGSLVSVTPTGLTISTAGRDVQIPKLIDLDGTAMTPSEFLNRFELKIGDVLPVLDVVEKEALTRKHQELSRYESWWQRHLSDLHDFEIPYASRQFGVDSKLVSAVIPLTDVGLPSTVDGLDYLTAVSAAYLVRLTQESGHVLFRHPLLEVMQSPFASYVPLAIRTEGSIGDTLTYLQRQIGKTKKRVSYPHDLLWRDPNLAHLRENGCHLPLSVSIEQNSGWVDVGNPPRAVTLRILIDTDGKQVDWIYDTAVYSPDVIALMQKQFLTLLHDVGDQSASDRPFMDAALLSPAEKEEILYTWNETKEEYPQGVCIHDQFVAQAAETPDALAVVFREQNITYRELDRRSNRLARYLIGLGVAPDVPVGVYMGRGIDMVVALYGIHKAGGAYLPLDPAYPADRLAFMVKDTATPVLVTQDKWVKRLPEHKAQVVCLDGDWPQIAEQGASSLDRRSEPHHLSYLIYTSGSTGLPKGVMVEHRNVINFFAGMDQRVPHDAGDVWLAVTSLSFDISVLELFWTLCRGLTVVLYDGQQQSEAAPQNNKPIDFSLYYFASDEGEAGVRNKYELLLEGAKFADTHSFSAVWTPERHFHAFGGLYPNPSVMSAALATITNQIQLRAGSCVLPLHHPARVAEEWAVVDNLSNGRVGISFAAGWQPDDFIFQPQNFADRKAIMFRDIEVVRSLWRGETVTYDGGNGAVAIRTLPRPIQPELPVWVTAAGNPETFRAAGEQGFNILTHLLGQSITDLQEKIEIYRQARRDAGYEGGGTVSILLHTLIGDDLEQVKELVRQPMTDYLRSSLFLIRQAAWSFPTFKQKADESGRSPLDVFDEQDLSDEEMDALLAHSFERYFAESSLLGTPTKALKTIDQLKAAGVDEIACQIDFGVPTAETLAHLPQLDRVRQLANPSLAEGYGDYSIPALIARHQVTHFQCTPSMMSLLLADERQKEALGHLQVCLLGGEALPQSLAGEVLAHLPENGRLINMYGPTETTIWSSTFDVEQADGPISIGRPIANTDLFIVDERLNPVPVGLPGELLIGGDGVVRGYLNREALTAERFVENRFRAAQGEVRGRMYRTGDLARYRPDGTVEFLGRLDFQVKLRGYRIELGEIESLLAADGSVRDAVVMVREDEPGDKRLVAYLIPQAPHEIDGGRLREHLADSLPDFMIPAHFVTLAEFPLTPNRKTDRNNFPAPHEGGVLSAGSTAVYQPPENPYQQQIAEIWQQALGLPRVGIQDNFFQVGGHSILAVQVHRRIREQLNVDFNIADMFRYATVASLSAFLGNQGEATKATQQIATDRARKRREAMGLQQKKRRRR